MTRWLPVMFGVGIAIWVVALGLLAVTAGDSAQFGRLQPWLLMVNIVGLVVLLALIAGRLADLVRDRRGNVPGSRLRARHVLMLCSLVLAPLLLVFTFSVVFLTRGIDSWFHVEVRQGLSDALGLSRAVRSRYSRMRASPRTCGMTAPRRCSPHSIRTGGSRARRSWPSSRAAGG